MPVGSLSDCADGRNVQAGYLWGPATQSLALSPVFAGLLQESREEARTSRQSAWASCHHPVGEPERHMISLMDTKEKMARSSVPSMAPHSLTSAHLQDILLSLESCHSGLS